MSKNLKISLGLIGAAVIAVLAFAVTSGGEDDSAEPAATTSDRVVRPDSQKLSTAEDGKVTFVEFLDFECEACGAAYPFIEQLRETYDGKVTFVVRNFPLHNNSMAAAKAAEAAAAQGKFEEMYQMLFETQAQWGESQDSKEDVFFGYAEEMGLDMAEFKAVYDDPATEKKIKRDQADGKALGVEGTPSFFINGEKVDEPSPETIIAKIDAELGT
jgi:protein-disulfide isomerase